MDSDEIRAALRAHNREFSVFEDEIRAGPPLPKDFSRRLVAHLRRRCELERTLARCRDGRLTS